MSETEANIEVETKVKNETEKIIVGLPVTLTAYSGIIERNSSLQLLFTATEVSELYDIAKLENDTEMLVFLDQLNEIDMGGDGTQDLWVYSFKTPLYIREMAIPPSEEEKKKQRKEVRDRGKLLKKRKLDVLYGIIQDDELKATITEEEAAKLIAKDKEKTPVKAETKANKKFLADRSALAIKKLKQDHLEKWKQYQKIAGEELKIKIQQEQERKKKEKEEELLLMQTKEQPELKVTQEMQLDSVENGIQEAVIVNPDDEMTD